MNSGEAGWFSTRGTTPERFKGGPHPDQSVESLRDELPHSGGWRVVEDIPQRGLGLRHRCAEEEFVTYAKDKGWDIIELGPAIEQAILDSERFGTCFLAWGEPEDRRVMMQLKEQRVRRFIDRPLPVSWEKIHVREWAAEDRRVRDFQEVGQSMGQGVEAGRRVMATTLPVDAQGFLARKFLRAMGQWEPEVVVVEGPGCSRWDVIEQGLGAAALYVYNLEFISTELGAKP